MIDQLFSHFLEADLAALFLDDLAALFFEDLAADFLAADLTGVFLAADLTGVFLAADLTGVFFELLAICLVFDPLAAETFEADLLVADLTGVDGWATEVSTTGVVGFSALLAGVDGFLLDGLAADLLEADCE